MKLQGLLCIAFCCAGCGDGVLEAFDAKTTTAASAGLLDDFEDQDNRAGGDGWWYATDDETGPDALMTFDAVENRGASRYVVRLHAGPTTDYGAFLGLDVPGGVYDIRRFGTLSFAARAEPPFAMAVVVLDPIFDSYEVRVDLSTEWQDVTLPLSDFVNGDGLALDAPEITHLQFWVPGPSPVSDFWIDDVWLLE